MTPEERMKKVKARAAGTERYQPCGVCMGHSPSWDGHDSGCWVSDMTFLIKEVERLQVMLGGHDPYAIAAQRDSARAERDASRDAIDAVRARHSTSRMGALGVEVCVSCGYPAPCPDLAAITGTLGGDA